MDRDNSGVREKDFRYLVLAARTLKQVQLAGALSKRFPKCVKRISE